MKFVISSIFLLSSFAYSGEIKGKFSFSKRPPKLGLIYMSEDHSLKKKPVIDQKDKEFLENMYVGANGSTMTFKNSDEVNHNIYANDPEANASFDVGLMPAGSSQEMKIEWMENKVIKLSCKIHPNMRTYVANVDSKYHKVLDIPKKKSFEFSLKDVPDELSEVSIWLSVGFSELKAKVAKGESVKLDVKKGDKVYGTLELKHE